jgi:hypothetical protein
MGCPLFELSMKGKTKKKVQEQFGKLLLVAIFALPVIVAAAGLKPLTFMKSIVFYHCAIISGLGSC